MCKVLVYVNYLFFEMFVLIVVLFVLFAILHNWNDLRTYLRFRISVGKLPGPKGMFILGNIPDILGDKAILFKNVRQWALNYYPVYGMTAGLFYCSANVCSPEDFEAIASGIKNIQKGPIYTFLHRWLGDGLLTSTGSKWQTRRKILTPAFHYAILQQFLTVFWNETGRLVDELKSVSHEPFVNVVPYISHFTLSSINETAMGTRLDLENSEDRAYCSSIHQLGKLVVNRLTRPWFYNHFSYYILSKDGYKEKRLIRTLHDFTNTVIENRLKTFEKFEVLEDDKELNYSKRKRMAMLDLLLNAKLGEGDIDDEGIRDEVNTFMFEGHDTTSMALCFTLLTLASHKDVQEKILQEIEATISDKSAQPTYNELQELKYTERCIKECLRLYPSVPFIARVLDQDVTTSHGYLLPKGTSAQIHIYDIHRNPKIWPDPEKFDPDRFLPENCSNRHPFAYVPFSAGPRNCIGQKFAMLELKVALCGILRNFILEPVDTPENIVLIPDIVLRTENDAIKVKFVQRTK